MSGDIILDDKQKWAQYFAGVLKSRGFYAAAKSLEEIYSPFPFLQDTDVDQDKNWKFPNKNL